MYNDRVLERIERFRIFFEKDEPEQVMVCVSPYTFDNAFVGFNSNGKKLKEWRFPEDIEQNISSQIAYMDYYLEVTDGLDDDYVPIVSPFLGVGFLGAMLTGRDVVFTDDTSWVHDTVDDWDEALSLKYDPQNRHQILIQSILRELKKKQKENFTIGSMSHFAPIDMANAVRGNTLFYDYYDNPQKVKALLGRIVDYTIDCQRALRDITGEVEGGFTTASMWMPGDGLFMSEDAGDLGSSELYREFAMPATQKVLSHFGAGFVHHHAKGWQIHKDITKLKDMTAVEFSWDPNCPRPVDHLDELYAYHTHKVPLQIRCRPEDIYKNIEIMRKFRLIIMLNVENVGEAQDVLNFLKDKGLR